jgi:hypothetical protein
MNEYLLSIIGTVLLSSFIVAIVPDGKMSGVIKGVAKMICLLVITAPISVYLSKGEKNEKNKNLDKIFSSVGIQTDMQFIQYYSEMRLREAEIALEKEILDRYFCEVQIVLESESVSKVTDFAHLPIAKIHVRLLDEKSEQQKENIKEYLIQTYSSEVSIE